MTRPVVDAILSMTEYNRFTKGIFGWVGFETKWIEFENVERNKGETKWSFWKLFLYSIDGITAFSTAPLAVASIMGVLFCFAAFSLISGVQLFCMGIVGQYLSKTYMEVKRRPIYLIKEDI